MDRNPRLLTRQISLGLLRALTAASFTVLLLAGCASGTSSNNNTPIDIGRWNQQDATTQPGEIAPDENALDVAVDVAEDANVGPQWAECIASAGDDPVGVFFTKSCAPQSACSCADANGSQIVASVLGRSEESTSLCVMQLQDFTITDALIDLKQGGIHPRVVIDDRYSDPTKETTIMRLQNAGVAVRWDDDWDALMHSKFVVVDDRWVLISSGNFSTYDAASNANNTLVFDSPQLADLLNSRFDSFWSQNAYHDTSQADTGTVIVDGHEVEVLFGPSWDTIDRLRAAIAGATNAIHFSIFAFTLDELKQALQDRCGEVEIIGIYDENQADDFYSIDFNDWCPQAKLVPAKVQSDFGFEKLHHKVLLVDPGGPGALVITGSTNWSYSASTKNDEVMVVVHHPAVVAQFEAEFQARLNEAD